MSTNRQEHLFYPTRTLDHDVLNYLLTKGTDKVKAALVDMIQGGDGGFFAQVGASATSPASKSIEIPALEGQDTNGEHLRTTSTTTLDCTSTTSGTNLFPGGAVAADTWISVFVSFAWTESDAHSVGGTLYYGLRTEGVSFTVVKGSATGYGANPGSGAVKVCDILLEEGDTAISAAAIKVVVGINQPTLTPLHSGFAKLSGARFTGNIFKMLEGVKRPYVYRNSGAFKWAGNAPVDVPSNPDAWPVWGYNVNAGYVYTAHTIHHGLGDVALTEVRAQPCLTENNQTGGYAYIETLLGGNIPGAGGGVATGNIVTLQAYPYNGTFSIVVFGTLPWVNWFRFAGPVAREWRWVAMV